MNDESRLKNNLDWHKRYCDELEAKVVELEGKVKAVADGACAFSGPGRGDCEHFVGLPGESIPGQHDGPDDTVDYRGKPNGWCQRCWDVLVAEKKHVCVVELEAWTISRWDAEVKNRPAVNRYRRTLDNVWRQIYRHISGGVELPRPKHIPTPPEDEVDSLKAKVAELERRLVGPGRFMADDGDGEREEFDSLEGARDWANVQISYRRDQARDDGEWPGEVEGVTIWLAIEQAQEVPVEGGFDFELRPCPPSTDTAKGSE